jgi:hypothetical protein
MWVKVDDVFPEHPKVLKSALALGGSGSIGRVIGFWLHALCYANRNLTDGVVPKAVARTWTHVDRKPLDVMDAMVKAGLMDRHKGDFAFHNYSRYQPTAEDVKNKREKDKLRKRSGSSGYIPDSARNPNGIDPTSAAPVPTRPGPSRPDPRESVCRKEKRSRAIARAWISYSKGHD